MVVPIPEEYGLKERVKTNGKGRSVSVFGKLVKGAGHVVRKVSLDTTEGQYTRDDCHDDRAYWWNIDDSNVK